MQLSITVIFAKITCNINYNIKSALNEAAVIFQMGCAILILTY